VVFACGSIYETRFAKGSDKSNRYNVGIFTRKKGDCLPFLIYHDIRASLNTYVIFDKVAFTCGFIYETGFAKESDKSDRYNIWGFHQLLTRRDRVPIFFQQLWSYFRMSRHKVIRRFIILLIWLLVMDLGFMVLLKCSEDLTWEESLWQVWQTVTTVGYGNRPAETLPGRWTVMILGTIALAVFVYLLSLFWEVKAYFQDLRRFGMIENPFTSGYVLIHCPGEKEFESLVREIRVVEPNVGICVIDDRLEELPPGVQIKFKDIHFVKGNALDREVYEKARIDKNKVVIVFPEDKNSSDSDGTTKTIVELLSEFVNEDTRIIHVLVDQEHVWMFKNTKSTSVWQSLEMLAVVQESQDQYSAQVIARVLKNTEGANPQTVKPVRIVGWTWKQLSERAIQTAYDMGISVNLFALIHDRIPVTCPKMDQKIQDGDLISILAFPGFKWDKFEQEMKH